MTVTFHKMHGLGNDFVVLDLRSQDFHINESTAISLANRHTGIGCDQVLVLREPRDRQHLASFEIWNADGSRAEQCGNGVRCLALYLHMRSESPPGRFLLGGPTGAVTAEYLGQGNVRVDMGQPIFEASRIPILLKPADGWYSLNIGQQILRIGAASMGNPHALLLVDDVGSTNVAELGAAISRHSAFPDGCNVGFAQIKDRDNIRLRVFERGAAETRACGSGACAAMSILCKANLVNETIKVTQAGGNLIISWTQGENSVIMTGPASHVYKGKLT